MNNEVKNDHVAVTVAKEPGCKVKFDIKVAPLAAKAAYEKAIKMVNKEVSLPGFRKGKAPGHLVIEHYGKYVDSEWKELLVQTAFKEAVALTKIYPLNQRSVQKPSLNHPSQEEGAQVVIQFEATPEVPSVDAKEFTFTSVETKEVTEKDVDQAVEEVRWHYATWTDIKDRPVEDGDCVLLDIFNLTNPGQIICQDTLFDVTKEKMGKWMYDLILGKNIGDTAEGMSEKPENQKEEFIPVLCKVVIKGIQKATLPEMTDELAKKVGASDVADLRVKARKRLEKAATQEAHAAILDQCEAQLLEKYPFDLPSSLVQSELKERIDNTKKEMRALSKTNEQITEELKTLSSTIEKEVEESMRLFFLSRKIAEDNKIGVTKDELVKELMMEMYGSGKPLDPKADQEEARSRLYMKILSQKVKEHLIEQAKI